MLSNQIIAQVNDNCTNAIEIVIPANGYGNGFLTSDTISVSSATTEAGEYFTAGIPNGKSV